MPTAHSIVLSPPDFCRKTASRVLACVALLAFLALQLSMVWHGPEHALNEASRVIEAATSLQATSAKAVTADIAATLPNSVMEEDVVSPPSATVFSHAEQVSSASELCLKCLEDVSNRSASGFTCGCFAAAIATGLPFCDTGRTRESTWAAHLLKLTPSRNAFQR